MWFFGREKGASGFSYSSTAQEVTHDIDASGLTAIVTGTIYTFYLFIIQLNLDKLILS